MAINASSLTEWKISCVAIINLTASVLFLLQKPIVCDAMVDVTMTEADKIKVHCQLGEWLWVRKASAFLKETIQHTGKDASVELLQIGFREPNSLFKSHCLTKNVKRSKQNSLCARKTSFSLFQAQFDLFLMQNGAASCGLDASVYWRGAWFSIRNESLRKMYSGVEEIQRVRDCIIYPRTQRAQY